MPTSLPIAVLSVLLLAGCAVTEAPSPGAAPAPAETPVESQAAGSPVGTWGDDGRRLWLRADGRFLREVVAAAGDAPARADRGRWAPSPDGASLWLFHGGGSERYTVTAEALVPSGDERGMPDAAHAAPLQRVAAPANAASLWRGEFTYFADAARFTDCAAGWSLPVASAGDYRTLERGYLAAGLAPMAGWPVAVRARLVQAPAMEGEGTIEALQVERWEGAEPSAACIAPAPTGTDWRIAVAGGFAMAGVAPARSASLAFGADGGVSGDTGCNRFRGSATWGEGRLAFGPLALTRRACPGEADARDRAVSAALAATARSRREGDWLVLLDEAGAVQALLRPAAPGP